MSEQQKTPCAAYPLNGCAHPQFCRDGCAGRPRRAPADPNPAWTEGVCGDGAAILRDGVPSSISDVLAALNAGAAKDAEIERLRVATTWQPIETAPKDGTRVLLLDLDQFIGWFQPSPFVNRTTGKWVKDAFDTYGDRVVLNPTHWLPLPPTTCPHCNLPADTVGCGVGGCPVGGDL